MTTTQPGLSHTDRNMLGATNLRLHRGLIPYHFEQRIRAGEHGAETYTSGTACDGEHHKPETDTA